VASVKMEIATDIDENKIVHEEKLSNMSISEEENKKIFHKEIELLTSQELVHDEKSSTEEVETLQLGKQSSKEHEEMISNEKLEKVVTEILQVNEENDCDKLNSMTTLDANKIENMINNCDVSADTQNITQFIPKENTHEHISICENVEPDVRQEILQKSPKIIKSNISNDINIIQNKYTNQYVINQVTELSIHDNKIQVNNPSLQKQTGTNIY